MAKTAKLVIFISASILLTFLSNSSVGAMPQIGDIVPEPVTRCVISGCSGEVCADIKDPVNSICLYQEGYACLKYAKCELQKSGGCGWTYTDEYRSCDSIKTPNPTPHVDPTIIPTSTPLPFTPVPLPTPVPAPTAWPSSTSTPSQAPSATPFLTPQRTPLATTQPVFTKHFNFYFFPSLRQFFQSFKFKWNLYHNWGY